jgi:hypothetical protein
MAGRHGIPARCCFGTEFRMDRILERRQLRFLLRCRLAVGAVASIVFGIPAPVAAAPLPSVAPVHPCGKVRQVHVLPPKTLPAVPGISGSAGRERHWPSRAVIVLSQVRGITRQQRQQLNVLLSTSSDGGAIELRPGHLLLILTGAEAVALRPSVRICVTGFVVRGDEGGTWTNFGELRVLPGGRQPIDRH